MALLHHSAQSKEGTGWLSPSQVNPAAKEGLESQALHMESDCPNSFN